MTGGFFDAHPFSPEQMLQLRSALAGVLPGDEATNDKFIEAIEVQIGGYLQWRSFIEDKLKVWSTQFGRLAKTAREFAAAVSALDDSAGQWLEDNDPAGAIRFETVKATASLALETADVAARLNVTYVGDPASTVVEGIARRYFSLFGEPPSAARGGIFSRVLSAIDETNVLAGIDKTPGVTLNIKEHSLRKILRRAFPNQAPKPGRKPRPK